MFELHVSSSGLWATAKVGVFSMLHQCVLSRANAPGNAGTNVQAILGLMHKQCWDRPDLGNPRSDCLLDVLWIYECTRLSEHWPPVGGI